ncbi:magnesium and cobalt transport protein CorA [Cellulomonas composti]|uniref:Magnesium transport protein CorA n=1 Tax=Cellulomonas composti TaxID=266130 RepID=A0A511J623_9CELL|nr:magnesium and cobalt transport protein CorA [Cellulomonas composti]GEL93437.1 hypothetical protein CCO02nite_00950 [Cellulomonas composti]
MADEQGRTFYVPGEGGWHRVAELPALRPVWVDTVGPHELRAAAEALGVGVQGLRMLDSHPVFDEVARWADPTTRPSPQDLDDSGRHVRGRVNRSNDGEVMLSMPTVAYVESTRDVHTGILTCVVTEDFLITCELGDAGVLSRAAEKLCDGLPLPDTGVRQVLAATLVTLVNRAADVEAALGDAVAQVERTVFSDDGDGTNPLSDVYGLKREIAEARRALGPMSSTLPELEAETSSSRGGGRMRLRPGSDDRSVAWLRHVRDRADRIGSHLDAHDGLLDAMLSVHLSQVSVRQNEDMRKISAWAAMITVPTLIAGIYGMNFRYMPELDWKLGYPLVLVVMGAVCAVLYRSFRRSGWL